MTDNDNPETVSLSAKGDNAIENLREILAGYDPQHVTEANVTFVLGGGRSSSSDAVETVSDDTTTLDGESTGSTDATTDTGSTGNGDTADCVTDSSRHCPEGATIKHAALEILARETEASEGQYFASTKLTEKYGEEYGLNRSQISNALIGLYNDRIVERNRNSVFEGGFKYDDLDGLEYCYVMLQPGEVCLSERGPHPDGPDGESA